MIINKISITKSKTVGIVTQQGKTKFKKVQIMSHADLEKDEDENKAYQKLSQYVENCFKYEENIK